MRLVDEHDDVRRTLDFLDHPAQPLLELALHAGAGLQQADVERAQLTVHSVTQVPYYLHLMLAQTLGLDSAAIRVIKPFVGGGFGRGGDDGQAGTGGLVEGHAGHGALAIGVACGQLRGLGDPSPG